MTACPARRIPGVRAGRAVVAGFAISGLAVLGLAILASFPSAAQTGPIRLEPPGAQQTDGQQTNSRQTNSQQTGPQQTGPAAGSRTGLPENAPAASGPMPPAGAAPRAWPFAAQARPSSRPLDRSLSWPSAQGGGAPPLGRPFGGLPGGGTGVTVTRLGALDVDFAGTLGEDAGGFGAAMWRGASRETLLRLLPALPARAVSPAGRDLLRRLLLSSAEAPEPPTPAVPRGAVLVARIERLVAMGEGRGVDDLLQANASLRSAPLARIRADRALLRNDASAACDQEQEVGAQQSERYWARLNVFCRAIAGEHERAALGARLLRETGSGDADAVFDTLVRALRGDVAEPLASLKEPTPLTLAMLRAARQPLPDDAMAADRDGAVLIAIAGSPNATLETRLAAAERAVALGAMAGESLAQIYAAVPHTPTDIADAIARARALGGAKGRALLHRAIETQADLAERVALLRAALDTGGDRVGYLASIRANLAALEAIPSTPTFIAAAGDFARAFLHARRFTAARRWLALVARSSGGPADDARLALWPYAVLDDGRERPGADGAAATIADPADFEAWRAAWRARDLARDPEGADARAALLYALLQAFDYPVAGASWGDLLKPPFTAPAGAAPGLALARAMEAAARDGRVGETVLFSLVSLGAGGVAQAAPPAVPRAVEALRRVGLEDEARQLAIEALVAAGL